MGSCTGVPSPPALLQCHAPLSLDMESAEMHTPAWHPMAHARQHCRALPCGAQPFRLPPANAAQRRLRLGDNRVHLQHEHCVQNVLHAAAAAAAGQDDYSNEIAVMKELDHPNLVKLYEVIYDPSNNKLLMSMEYVEGGCVLVGSSASEKVRGGGPCDDDDKRNDEGKVEHIAVCGCVWVVFGCGRDSGVGGCGRAGGRRSAGGGWGVQGGATGSRRCNKAYRCYCNQAHKVENGR